MPLRKERVSRDYEVGFLRKVMQGRLLLPAVVFLIMFLLLFSVGGIFVITKVKEKMPGVMNVSGKNLNEKGKSENGLAFDASLSVNYQYALHRGDEVEILLKGLKEHFYLKGFIKYTASPMPENNEKYKNIIVQINEIKNADRNDFERIRKEIPLNSNINVEVFIRSRPLFDLFIGEKLRRLVGGFV